MGTTVGTVIRHRRDRKILWTRSLPNPASDMVNLRMEGMEGLLQIRIYDMSRKGVMVRPSVVQPGRCTDLSRLIWAPGCTSSKHWATSAPRNFALTCEYCVSGKQ